MALAVRTLAVVATVSGLAACGDETSTRSASLRGPSAMALAGPGMGRLFVANQAQNGVQVLDQELQGTECRTNLQ